MDLRDKFRKAAGLFVELPPEEMAAQNTDGLTSLDALDAPAAAPTSRTVEQIVSGSSGPSLEEVHAAASAIRPESFSSGNVEFASIYQQAGVPASPFTAEQTLDMLASMPAELPMETKRQTVKVTLSAMGKSIGATPETIVADASRKLTAIAAYAESVTKSTTDLAASTEQEIAELQAQIEEKRKAVQLAKAAQTQILERCHAEMDHLDDVLEFFSLDVPPSKLTSSNQP